MDENELIDKVPSDWRPITDPVDLALLGKLLEELNECGATVARCLIQGLDGIDPETKEVNRDKLQKEIADVTAMTAHAGERYKLDFDAMSRRADIKYEHKRKWFLMMLESLK